MANLRAPLSNRKAKDVRDSLVKDITDHQRNIGRLPNVLATEQFVDTEVMPVVEVDHEADRARDIYRPGPKMKKALEDPDVRVIERPGPTYLRGNNGELMNLDGTPATDPRGGLYAPGTKVGDDDIPAEVVHAQLLKLKQDPLWDERIMAIWLGPHEGDCTPLAPCQAVKMCTTHGMRKANAILNIVRASFSWPGYEDPRKTVEPKIIVSG